MDRATGKDAYGNTLTADAATIGHFNAGLADALSFDQSGIAHLRNSVETDPDFALAHALLGRQLSIHGAREEGAQAFATASQLSNGSERERSAINAMGKAGSGNPSAFATCLDHLDRWPTDIMVAPLVIGPFGLMSHSDDLGWREAGLDLMRRWSAKWPADDWWFLANLAFTEAEAGHAGAALERAGRSLDLRETGTAAHSYSHAQIELALFEEGHTYATDWLERRGAVSDMQHHISWHRSIFEFEAADKDEAYLHAHFASELSAAVSDPMPLSTFSDNASFLWRMKLRGMEPSAEAVDETIGYMERHFPNSGFAFADIHTICIVALSGDPDRREKLRARLASVADERGTKVARHLVAACDGFFAFADGDYTNAARLIGPELSNAVVLGGSNPQRSIVSQTYDAACGKVTADGH